MNYQYLLQAKIDNLKQQGNYRNFLEVNKSAQHFPTFYYTNENGSTKSAVNWCSNDYLCLSTNEEVIAKLSFVAHRAGTASSGTRNISGTTTHHIALENTLAAWHKKQAALLFNGAYQANVTTLQTLGRNINDVVFISDENNHASIIEGIKASGKSKIIFKHNNMISLENILKEIPLRQPKIIVTESVFSMSGSIAPLKEIANLGKMYNALTYVDEVHAVGLYGQNGAGIVEQLSLQNDIDIINGTLAKAIGVFGGYIAASATTVDFIRSFGSGFIFTTSLPPAICAAANKSIQLIQMDSNLRKNFFDNVNLLRSSLDISNIDYSGCNSHITIVTIGCADTCKKIANNLLQLQGVYLQPIVYPTVPIGQECLRIVITPKHLPKHINHLAYSLQKIIYGNSNINRQSIGTFAAANAEGEA